MPDPKLGTFSPQDSMLFESSPELILFVSPQGRILAINNRIFDWIQIKPKQVIGKNVFDLTFITPESRELIKKNFRLRINQRTIQPYEIQVFDQAGNILVGRVSGKLLFNDRQLLGVVFLISNVTKLEKELQSRLYRSLQSEARYTSLFENMSSAVAICQFDQKTQEYVIKNVNRAFLKVEKVTKKEVLGKHLGQILVQTKVSSLERSVRKAWDSDIPQSFLVQVNQEAGQRVLKGTTYRLSTDELTIIYDDVTQAMLDQELLAKSEIRFRTIFDKANDALFFMQGQKFLDCNSATLAMFGLENKAEIVGHTPVEFSPLFQPDGLSSGRKALQYLHKAQAGQPQRFYWQHQKKNGDLIDAEVTLNRFKLEKEVYLIASVRDMSEQYETRRKLALSEKRFRSVVENAQAVVFVIDTDGRFVMSEGKKLSVFNLKAGQVVGMSAFEIYKDYPTIVAGIKTALQGNLYREILAINNTYFDIFYSPLKDENTKKVLGVVGMAVDVTESEKSKERLIELDEQRSEFISTASHQLRSPLVNIRWGMEILLNDERVKANANLKTQIENIHANTLKVIELVNNLLDTSRIYSNKLKNIPQKIDVIALLKEIFASSEADRTRFAITIFWNSPLQLEFKIDPNIFKAIFSNLVTNALRYNQRGGVIVIFVNKTSAGIEISLANTGKVVPKKELPKIFSKFFRGSNAKTEFEGTGLGLYIAKTYVDHLGGLISFSSGVGFGEHALSGNRYSGTILKVSLPKSK